MASLLCRGLRGGVFRAAKFSSFTRWPIAKTPYKSISGNRILDSYVKNEDSGVGDLQDINKPSVYSSTINAEKEQPELDYEQQYSKQDKNESVQPRVRKIIKRNRKQRTEAFLEAYRKPKDFHEDVESYNTLLDPRAFQQRRPEYKSLCYNPQITMEISLEEGETLLQKVACNGDLAPAEIADFFEKLSSLPEDHIDGLRSSEELEKLCTSSIKSLHAYTNGDLIRILAAFVRLKISRSHLMLRAYEREFIRRVWHFSINELLLVEDLFRCLSFNSKKFVNTMYNYMHSRCMDLSLAQAVQLTYLIGEKRYAPIELIEKLEAVILRDLQIINLDEIGTVCLGFFKTGNRLSQCVMRKFGSMIAENIDNVSNPSLVAVAKMFRFTRVEHLDFFSQLGQNAHKRIPRMGIQGIMHVTLCFSSLRILDEHLMNTVASIIPDRISYCRSKDIAKLLWSFGNLTYNPPNAEVFYSALITAISETLNEFWDFPEHLLTCLMGLAFCQRYPLHLIEVALSEEFILHSSKISNYELKKDLFTIAGSVEIECPEYTGKTISPEFRQEATEGLVHYSSQDIYRREEERKATSTLEILLGGPKFVKYHMILPHTRTKDLEVHFDRNSNPVSLNVEPSTKRLVGVTATGDLIRQLFNKDLNQTPEDTHDGPNASSKPKSTSKITKDLLTNTKPSTEIIKLALQVTNPHCYCGENRLLGLHNLKRRQLQKLGYVVVELPHWEWYPVSYCSLSRRLSYLRDKVFGTLDRLR